MNKINYN